MDAASSLVLEVAVTMTEVVISVISIILVIVGQRVQCIHSSWWLLGGCRSIHVVIAAVTFDISRLSLFSSLTIVMQTCKVVSVRD